MAELEITAVPQPDRQAGRDIATTLAFSALGSSFGRLGGIAAWLGSCQGEVPARPVRRPRLVIFAGAHGIAARTYEGVGLSAFAREADAELLEALHSGAGPIHTAARAAGVGIELVECPASEPIDVRDAMGRELCQEAFKVGQHAADREVDAGADLLIPAELGVGGSTVAATVLGRLTFTEPVAIVGPGSGATDAMWKTKVSVIRDAMFRARGVEESDILALLTALGSPSMAALVGFIYQAALRRTPLLVDGPLTATAAVLAERLAPGVRGWLLAAGASEEPAHRLALKELQLEPVLSLGMRAGQGLGALLTLPLLATAVELTRDEISAQFAAALAESNDADAEASADADA